MFRLSGLIITVGMAIGAVVLVRGEISELRHGLDAAERVMGAPGLITRQTLTHAEPSVPGAANHLIQIAKDCQVSGEQIHALAQDAAWDCAGSTCIEVMISLWGPVWSEPVMREFDVGSNG